MIADRVFVMRCQDKVVDCRQIFSSLHYIIKQNLLGFAFAIYARDAYLRHFKDIKASALSTSDEVNAILSVIILRVNHKKPAEDCVLEE